MTNHYLIVILILIGMFFNFGCASQPVARLQPSINESDKTVLLMNYELNIPEDLEWRENCVINLKNLDTQTPYKINLHPGSNAVQVEAFSGEYFIENIDCGSSRKWELNNFGSPKVVVLDKKINYLGRYTFKMSVHERINDLKIERGDREQTLKALRQSSNKYSNRWKSRLVSAYNGNVIPADYLSQAKAYMRGSTSHITGEKVSLNQLNFDSCERNEFKSNPVPLGILSYQVIYEKDHWIESKLLQNKNSFSESYILCVEDSLKKFVPGFSGHIEYTINF